MHCNSRTTTDSTLISKFYLSLSINQSLNNTMTTKNHAAQYAKKGRYTNVMLHTNAVPFVFVCSMSIYEIDRRTQNTQTRYSMQEGWVFGSRDAWFPVPMLLSADTMNVFHQRTRLSSPSKQGSNWHPSWDKQSCTRDTIWRQCYVTTSKKYLINCHTVSYTHLTLPTNREV